MNQSVIISTDEAPRVEIAFLNACIYCIKVPCFSYTRVSPVFRYMAEIKEAVSNKQICLVLVLALSAGLFNSMQKLSLTFILHETTFWCSQDFLNNTEEAELQGNLSAADQCGIFVTSNNSFKKIPCKKWVFATSDYAETAVSQFNLVCGNRYWIFLSQSIYILG